MAGRGLFVALALALVTVVSAHPWYCWFVPQWCQGPGDGGCCPLGGIWSSWKATSVCNDQCGGFGNQTMGRICLTEANCGPCSGSNQKNVTCNSTPCPFPRMSCAKGLVAKPKGAQILCVDPNEQVAVQPTLQASCCPAGGIMDLWTDWTTCNGAKCGTCGPMSTRKRACRTKAYGCGECSEQETTETRPCYTTPCKFPAKSCCKGTPQPSGREILCM